MQYTRLGRTGLVVSKLAFGAMTFGTEDGSGVTKVDQSDANNLIARALDTGVTYFNTADAYAGGQSEVILGKALGQRRHEVVLSTKVGIRRSDALLDSGLSARHIIMSAEESLKRLGTDYIDVYLLHRADELTPFEETAQALDDLVRRGLVRYLGMSNWSAWRTALALGIQQRHQYASFIASEMYYSLANRDLEQEWTAFAEAAGIGITIWSPLSGGLLSGKYSRENPDGGSGRRATFDWPPVNREKLYVIVDHLQQIAEHYEGASVAQIALAWVLAKPFVSSVLVGASSLKQLDDNLRAVEVTLQPDDLKALDNFTEPTMPYPNAGWMTSRMIDARLQDALDGSGSNDAAH